MKKANIWEELDSLDCRYLQILKDKLLLIIESNNIEFCDIQILGNKVSILIKIEDVQYLCELINYYLTNWEIKHIDIEEY